MRKLTRLPRKWLGTVGLWLTRVQSEIQAHKALVFIAIVVPLGTLAAAALGDENPALSIFAGVIVGAVVTAVATWVIAPDVERQVRKQMQREAALAAIAPKLFDSHKDALSAHGDVLDRPAKAASALEAVRDRAEEVATLSLATRDAALVQACWDWRSDCYKAVLAVWAVPAPPERNDGMVSITIVGDPDTLGPFEQDAYLSTERVGEKCAELLRQVLGALEMELPPFLKTDPAETSAILFDSPAETSAILFDSPAERQLQRGLVASVLRSVGENEELAEDAGHQLRKLAEENGQVRSELDRLQVQWLDSVTKDNLDGMLGTLIIEMAAEEVEAESASEYPLSTGFVVRHVLTQFRGAQGPKGGVDGDID